MEQVTNDDFDYFLNQMKRKFNVGAENGQGTMGDGNKEWNFGMGFSVQIPSEFEQADEDDASEIYWSEKRPMIILITSEREKGITFQFLNEEIADETLYECRETVKQLIEKIDERCVFYNTGEESGAVWFDYKSFAKNEAVYNLVFLFQTGQKKVLGTFFCIFEVYDTWKPAVLTMLKTIKPEEETNERL